MSTSVPRLRVASWPGYAVRHNPFMHIFLDGLKAAGCDIVSTETVEDCTRASADILLLHWPERVYSEAHNGLAALGKIRHLLTALANRPRNMRVIWLVHNLSPHDAGLSTRLVWPVYMRLLFRQLDGFMTLSPGTVDQVRAAFPALNKLPTIGLWHPVYPNTILPVAARSAARARLGVSSAQRVLGYCGQIRPYKGVEDLITAFRKVPDAHLRLFLAGKPVSAAFAATLRTMAEGDPRIHLRLEDLSADDFRTTLGVCDIIVAPLRRYLHSGSIVHALSAARPVLTPETPFSTSLREVLGPDWVHIYQGRIMPDHLKAIVARTLVQENPSLQVMQGEQVGNRATEFFRSLTR